MRYVVQAFGALVGFVAVSLMSIVIIALSIDSGPRMPGGPLFSTLVSAGVGLSFLGARYGWQAARRWHLKR